jgi:hypothetical protein
VVWRYYTVNRISREQRALKLSAASTGKADKQYDPQRGIVNNKVDQARARPGT